MATFEYERVSASAEGELLYGTTRQMSHNPSLNTGTTHLNNQEREEVPPLEGISDRNFRAAVNWGRLQTREDIKQILRPLYNRSFGIQTQELETRMRLEYLKLWGLLTGPLTTANALTP